MGLPPGLDPEILESTSHEGPLHHLVMDATKSDEVEASFLDAMRILGTRLDILVHVAGMSGRKWGDGPLHECTDEGWSQVFAANALSAFLTNRAAVRIMKSQVPDDHGLRGTILNIGSVLSESPAPEYFSTIAYASSKGAVRSLTIASASRYAADKIRFNLIEPGLIETPMAARAIHDPRISSYLATKQPIREGPGLATDVAEAALYLCEPASCFVTGIVLPVDGGWRISDGQIGNGESA